MKSQFKLLIISHMHPCCDLPRHGVFIVRLAEYFQQFGIETSFLIFRPHAVWPMYKFAVWKFYRPQNKLIKHSFEVKETRYFRPPGSWFYLWEDRFIYSSVRKKAKNWHRKKTFDAVLGIPIVPDAGAALRLGHYLGIPSAGLAIGSDVRLYPNNFPKLKRQVTRHLCALSKVFCVSQELSNCITNLTGSKVFPEVYYLPRNTALFSPPIEKHTLRQQLDISADAVVGVYVGNVSANKGMRELAAILPELLGTHPNFRMIIVGSGPSLKLFDALQAQYSNIILAGNQHPEKVANYLKCSDFMIFPSYSEGMPQAILEAMNCGLPVVATNVGGIPEAILHGTTGYLVEPKNEKQLFKAINLLLSDSYLRYQLSTNALSFSQSVFDPQSNSERFAHALKSLAHI